MKITRRGERVVIILAGVIGLTLGLFAPWHLLPWAPM